MSAAADVDRSRYGIMSNRGLSFKTMVAFGPHASVPHFHTVPETDILILDNSTCIIDSGGQYIEGTAEVSRTRKFFNDSNFFYSTIVILSLLFI